MLEKLGFIGLSTGGGGVFYARVSAIIAIQERINPGSKPDLKSRVFLAGYADAFLIQDDPATIGECIERVQAANSQ